MTSTGARSLRRRPTGTDPTRAPEPAVLPTLLPVDRWVAFCNLLMLAAWLPLAPYTGLARAMVLVHLTALALPALLRRAPARLSPPVGFLRDFYPVLWVAAFWSELSLRHAVVPTAVNDRLILALDQAVFQGHPNLTWMPAMPAPWFSEAMHAAYFAYYPLLLGIPLYLVLRGCRDTLREGALRLAATYLACFLIYTYFPVVGPLEMFPRYAGSLTQGFFYQVNAGIRHHGDALGTAFPSSHVAGSITLAWIAWRRAPGWAAALATVVAVLVAFATVYTQNHFAIDALAGVVVAAGAQGLLVPLLHQSTDEVLPFRLPGQGRTAPGLVTDA